MRGGPRLEKILLLVIVIAAAYVLLDTWVKALQSSIYLKPLSTHPDRTTWIHSKAYLNSAEFKKAFSDPRTLGRARKGPILGCEQLSSRNYSWPEPLSTVAIVGNGPISKADRLKIEGMDLVIRFNKLQSYGCGEKFDVWASRHSDAVTTRFWGIGMNLNIPGCPSGKLLDLAKHIWLLNGGDGPFNFFLKSYPQIRERANYVWLDCRSWVERYITRYAPVRRDGKLITQDSVSPSSGWLVLSMVRECAPQGAKIHIFGFNWPSGQWPAHQVNAEKEEIERLVAQGHLEVHPTPCKDKYVCKD